MKNTALASAFSLLLLPAFALAQDDNRAVPRGSAGSSDAGSRHTGSSSSGGASSSSEGNRGGGSPMMMPGSDSSPSSASAAGARRPRPGTGTGDRGAYAGGRYTSSPYSYYSYDPYYYSYAWGAGRPSYGRYRGYYGYYDYGYLYGDYYGYYPGYYAPSYRYRSGNIGQIRTLVEPAKTRVYVDGYYAGEADDFDGLLQRLNVSPGRHDITFKLEGYNTHTMSVYVGRDQTLKVRWDMVRGSGETRDVVPEDRDRRDRDADRDREYERDREREADRDRDREREYDRDRAERPRETDLERERRSPGTVAGRGEVVFEIDPPDASVYVDGEFLGKASQVTRIELPSGPHRVEVVRPGYRTEETEVRVDADTRKVVVRLERR